MMLKSVTAKGVPAIWKRWCPGWRSLSDMEIRALHDGHDGDQRGHTDRQAQPGSQVTGAPQTRRLIGNRPAIQPAKITS
jgi:hypothetical protein